MIAAAVLVLNAFAAGIVVGFVVGFGPAARRFNEKSRQLDEVIEESRRRLDAAMPRTGGL